VGEQIPDVDSHAVLLWLGRHWPECRAAGLIGHGRPYQEQPAGGRQKRARVRAVRLRCTVCGATHTVLPPELGPHKRYRLEVLERVCAAAGAAKAGISAQLDGISVERIGAWLALWQAVAGDVIRFVELLLLADPLVRRPVLTPGMSDIACLRQLLGLSRDLCVLTELNRLLYAAAGAANPRLTPGRPCAASCATRPTRPASSIPRAPSSAAFFAACATTGKPNRAVRLRRRRQQNKTHSPRRRSAVPICGCRG